MKQQNSNINEDGDVLKLLKKNALNAVDKINEHEPIKITEWKSEYRDDIMETIRNAPEKIHRTTEKYLQYVEICNENLLSRPHANSKGIAFNVNKDAVDRRGKWTTICHEIGHIVDRKTGRVSSRFPEFRKYIVSDFELVVNKYQSVYNCNEIDAYAEISKALKSNPKYHSVSDLIGGITNNQCVGNYCHQAEYWKQANRLEKEAFAHFYEATLRNDLEKLEAIKEIFPNAYDMFEKILEVIIS